MIYLADVDVTIHQGDALEVLAGLPSESVDCCVTSPPFYGLRDYGADGQIGLEDTPDEWVARLVAVFREVRRVLKPSGTCWVECGDSYVSNPGDKSKTGKTETGGFSDRKQWFPRRAELKPKDLLGQPWMLAFALRADGWWLRQAIIWHKPNAMPESVTDRCTTAHSYVFLLAKQARYFFDADAIREPAEWARWGDQTVPRYEGTDTAAGWVQPKTKSELRAMTNGRSWESGGLEAGKSTWPDGRKTGGPQDGAAKNARSVWTIPTRGYPDAHFATFPEELARRCILAGSSERGVCRVCGKPWERETTVEYENPGNRTTNGPRSVEARDDPRRGTVNSRGMRLEKRTETLGWRSTCDHDAAPAPAVILDPFLGSGTTGLVARKHGRHAIGVELNADYCALAAKRLAQQSLFAEAL